MSQPVEHSRQFSIYTLDGGPDLDDLSQFVSDLYAVGAVGDERLRIRDYTIRVEVRSTDLMPAHGHGPVRLRYPQWRSLRRQIAWLWFATIVSGIAALVLLRCVFLR